MAAKVTSLYDALQEQQSVLLDELAYGLTFQADTLLGAGARLQLTPFETLVAYARVQAAYLRHLRSNQWLSHYANLDPGSYVAIGWADELDSISRPPRRPPRPGRPKALRIRDGRLAYDAVREKIAELRVSVLESWIP